MHLQIDIQNASSHRRAPTNKAFHDWLSTALNNIDTPLADDIEISIRIVDNDEMQALNREYRQRDKPTNVLSFSTDLPTNIRPQLLGDIVICAPVVATEAADLGKSEQYHWAHMAIHGLLHLLGYDHIDDDEALAMEALEAQLLAQIEGRIKVGKSPLQAP